MKNALTAAAVLALLGVGVYYLAHDAKRPADDSALSSIVKASAAVKSICVTPIQNLSKKPVTMDGVDDVMVSQLRNVGFRSRKISDGGEQCDANTNAEIVDINGRGRKTARLDYRLTLTGEQVPRLSSSVEGKSAGNVESLEKNLAEFDVSPDTKESAGAAREAIVAAMGKAAAQIDTANKRGLPPWQAKER